MDIKDLKAMPAKELNAHIEELRREQFNLRMQRGTGQLNKTHRIKEVRREIARSKMLLGNKK
jgi:large subunit ribosomal protein L29